MFDKLLIANRGEIACRIMKTARRMGIRTVAVFSDADARALHAELADEAYCIGPESYLAIGRILDAARRSGAQAIHPGYGFLSENADFAEACNAAGVTFIGPSAAAIRAMGSKSAAKALMEKSGVPIVAGYHGEAQDSATLAAAAARIGYPVLIKASAGGGGRGMRVVTDESGLEAAIASAQREAASAFGDGRLLIEKYLTQPRHIEIQIFADTHGNTVSLFERDCSIQRRHQKVVEEAPAPGMDAARRETMGEAACKAARAVGYVGAGTVEFIVHGGAFYFMEMNTRLQVEHRVTEAITGEDLVEWQLLAAAGGMLPKTQDELAVRGHAIEMRIYAEDPARSFLPAGGVITHLQAPHSQEHVRVDSGVRAGDSIGIHYDPMIAKLIAWDQDRAGAIRRLRRALAEYEIVGVATNIAFLSAVAAHPAFGAAEIDTGFIERHSADLILPLRPASRTVLAAAMMRVLSDHRDAVAARAKAAGDPWSPWNTLRSRSQWVLRDGDVNLGIAAHPQPNGNVTLDLPDGPMEVRDGEKALATVVRNGAELTVIVEGVNHRLQLIDPLAAEDARTVSDGRLTAPMPGRIVRVLAENGDAVKRSAALLVLEAMKMEYTITAPADGTVIEIRCVAGDLVDEGAELISFVPGLPA